MRQLEFFPTGSEKTIDGLYSEIIPLRTLDLVNKIDILPKTGLCIIFLHVTSANRQALPKRNDNVRPVQAGNKTRRYLVTGEEVRTR